MLYTIEDTTLNSLADAIRLKAIGTTGADNILVVEPFKIDYWYGSSFELPSYVKKVKITGYIDYDTGDTNYGIKGLYIVPEKNTNPPSVPEHPDCIVLQEKIDGYIEDPTIYNSNFEVMIEGNTWTFSYGSMGSGGAGITLNFTAIGLDENGNEFRYTPLEMIDVISGFNLEVGKKLKYNIEKDTGKGFTLTAEDLEGITSIGNYAFYASGGLRGIDLPEGITTIQTNGFYNCFNLGMETNKEIVLPSSLVEMGQNVFYGCSNLYTIRILNNESVIKYTGTSTSYDPFNNCVNLTTIYVPSNLYDGYCSHNIWSKYKNKFSPVGEWVFDPVIRGSLLFNQSKEYSISLNGFDYTPEFSITSTNPEVATVSDIAINEDNSLITFKVNSLAVEGNATINISINSNIKTFEFSGEIIVYESYPESTYEVVPVDGATYGFALNDAGYWESQNKKQPSSYALCQINISNLAGKTVYLDCINYAESNYDYGLLGSVNQVLVKNYGDDTGVKENFKGKQSANIVTVEYTDAVGDCFIQVKFKKDGSGDKDNDSIQFQVRFGD